MQLEGRIRDIYDIFNNYYGESSIDIQQYNNSNFGYVIQRWVELDNFIGWVIMIHWNEVQVTNEKDESITIWNLYGIVFVNNDGTLFEKPVFNRSTYNIEQYTSGYVHSHLYSRDFTSERACKEFLVPCFGQGPINSTMESLRHTYDENIWRMFVWELDKMVHVESLTGGPYIRMTSIQGKIGNNQIALGNTTIVLTPKQKEFTSELCKRILDAGILTFSYVDNHYVVNINDARTIIELSDFFIQEYNNDEIFRNKFSKKALKRYNIIKEAFLYNGKLFNSLSLSRRIGETIPNNNITLFKFKNQDVKLEIINTSGECVKVTILNVLILTQIIYNVQKFINIYYGREETISEENGKII